MHVRTGVKIFQRRKTMKKLSFAVVCVLVFALMLTTLAGCSLLERLNNGDSSAEDKVTVSWYQGSKLLKEEEVTKGSKVSTWTPDAVEGKDFTGWFAEASLSVPFDFETVINEDTDIFAKYTSNVFVEDEKSYYLIGTGTGDMKQSPSSGSLASGAL